MAFLGLLLVVCVVAPGLGELVRRLLAKQMEGLDPALERGVCTLIGLGFAGTLAYFVGLASTQVGIFLVLGLSLVGLLLGKGKPYADLKGEGLKAGALYVFLASIIPIVGVLAPSTTNDWDSIAYHLAVPKLWMADGHVSSISFIHHSNFPAAVDALNMVGLFLGGQSGAKAFQLAFFLFGSLALFGLVRERFGAKAAWWSVAAFAAIPIVQWEAGSAYLDIAHGLYAGLGAVLAIQGVKEPRRMVVGAMLMGLAVGSKYTGLQSLFALGLVLIPMTILQKGSMKTVGIAAGLSLAVGGAWYVKNAALVGNPVFPFFYEQFGGKNWNQTQADIYRHEQKTFGVPNALPLSIPHAILGLAYQPGRYINPGQELRVTDGRPEGGTGVALGAIGFPVMLAGLLGALRRRDAEEGGILLWLLLSLLMWAFLSQQSRYALSFAPPLCYLLGSVIGRPHWFGKVLMGAVAVQACMTAYVCKEMLLTGDRLQAAFGRVSADEYLSRHLGFYEAAKSINADSSVKRIALYDEVFGFYVDKPYFWASYGHTSELGYEDMNTADDLVAGYRKLGISHVYLNLVAESNDTRFIDLLEAAVKGQELPVDPSVYQADVQSRWKGLLVQAIKAGQLRVGQQTRAGLILIVPPG